MTYSSDKSGLVYGYLFAPNQAARAVSPQEIVDWLDCKNQVNSAQAHQFIWLHFSLSNANTINWLQNNLTIAEHFYETLREGPGSTRIEQADDSLVAVMNDVSYEFSYESSQIASMWMAVNAQVLISTRLQPLRSIERLRDAVRAGEPFDSTVSLLAHLLRDQADVLTHIVRDATSKVDSIEDNLLAGKPSLKRAKLGALRRVFVRLRRLLALEPGALFRLLNRPPSWFIQSDIQDLRDATEEFTVVLDDLSSLQERMKLLQEEIIGQTSEQTNRSIFMLTIFTVLALPINMIAGLFGMNVGGIPFGENTHGFWIVAGIVVSFTLLMGGVAFYKQRDAER